MYKKKISLEYEMQSNINKMEPELLHTYTKLVFSMYIRTVPHDQNENMIENEMKNCEKKLTIFYVIRGFMVSLVCKPGPLCFECFGL